MNEKILQKEKGKEVLGAKIIDQEAMTIIIPQCCREGWDSCPHGVKRPKPRKRNIGL